MKVFKVTFLFILFSGLLFSQNDRGRQAEFKKMTAEGSFRNSQVKAYPGDSTIDVTYYKLDLNLTYDPRYLKGAVTVGFRSTTAALNSFFLDLQQAMTVDSVTLNGGQKLSFTHSDAKLQITLPKAYGQSESASVIVYYQGLPGATGFGSFIFSTHGTNNDPIIWSLSEPYGASDWFPCKDTPGDKADSSDVWVRAPQFFTVASNGTLVSEINNQDGTKTTKWKNHYPIAQYLISIAMTNYYLYTNYFRYSKTDSMIVTHYIFPEANTPQNIELLNKTVDMLRIFSDKYELYPFIKEKYGHAQFGWGGGMEHQTITSLVSFAEVLVAHELSHQWFGDKVTCRDWNDIWLNEGFATYSEGVYYENSAGKDAYDSFINDIMFRSKYAQGAIYLTDISSVNNIFNSDRTYSKGGTVLHMLRGIVGDSVFFRILRTYLDDPKYSYGTAVTADFQSVAEKVYGKSLDYFFKEWIYGAGYPSYVFNWASPQETNNVLQLEVKQDLSSGMSVFKMPIQLKIKTTVGDTLVTVFNDQADQTFSITLNGQPQGVIFDPDNWILKEVTGPTAVQQEAGQPNRYGLEQNYPNPFNPSTKIKFHVGASILGALQRVSLKVFDLLGREVAMVMNEEKPSGNYEVEFLPANYNLPSGTYFYRLNAGNYMETKKMMYLK
ncbi:MAG: T9SS type A sorting domain-containing protein [Ignavibacteria bacterium]|jgi:aminopeptidase N|nr:T9SS type A sorting domain-containing protein [Ignavibacteria bacterium]MCU7502696.1 T9SS type A sorting domain-containing protein [Ignavibacteria bacterium]MCU7517375.1 T9SS type A sorting domain-containing protein [Ignavibacteria bacterium]